METQTQIPTPRNRYRLSDTVVGKIQSHDPRSPSAVKEWPDSECVGLRLTVGKSGRKWWDYRYRSRGRKACMRIGEWPAVTTTDARKRVNEMKAKLAAGIDPHDEKLNAQAMPTMSEYCEQYLEHARRTIRSAKDSEQRLRLHVLPTLGRRRLDDVRRPDIERLHSLWLDQMAPASANRVLASVKALFSHAVRMEVLAKSPAEGVKAHRENNARQRCLSGEELHKYIAAVAEEPNPHLRGLIQLLLATGMRRGEAMTAKWEHVDLATKSLLLPQTKSGKQRTVLLNEQAAAILAGLPRVRGNPYVFPGNKPGTHITEPKFAHERACKRAGIKNLRIHDLRHTFASLAVSNGASLYTVQALLGHASPIMSQRYAHLASDVLRQGSQQVSNILAAATAPTPMPPPAAPKPDTNPSPNPPAV